MKKAKLFSTLVALAMPTLVWADPILVRSGEHETFTRLVMRLPGEATWSLEDATQKSTLTIVGFDEGFDLSRAFEIIPKTRLAALLSKKASLEMQLNCDCRVVGFVESGEFLVIDIIDPDPETRAAEQARTTLALPTSQFSFGDLLWSTQRFPETLFPARPVPSEPEPEQTRVPDKPSPEIEAILGRVQVQLAKALSEAATRGLVDPKVTAPVIEEADVPVPVAPEPDPEPQPVEQALDIARTNIRISSSKDVPDVTREDTVALTGITCPDPDIVDVASWTNGDDFNTQRIRSNSELYDELGRLQSDKILKRVKMYLHFGMGAEALQTLNMSPGASLKYPELLDMAQYFEHGFIRNPRILHRFADCDSDLALWGALSANILPPEMPVDTHAALRGLERLPGHLKYFVAQDLSSILLERGELESASVAIRSFRRLPETDNGPPKLVDATAEILRQEDQSARQMLERIIAEGSAEAPYAVAELIDLDIRTDADVAPDIALLAEAYAFELKNTPGGAQLLRAHLLASASLAQFQKTFEILETDGGILNDETQRELANYIFSKVTTTASDPDFLTYHFDRLPNIVDRLEPDTIVEVSNRLLDLGFADEAGRLLGRIPTQMQTEKSRLLGSRILFEQGAFDQAIVHTEGMDTVSAAAVQAAALERTGNKTAAVRLYRKADQPELAITASWLSDDWLQLMDPDHPVFGPVAQVSRETIADLTSSEQMLSDTQAAIDASSNARKTLQELLESLDLTN
jgi:hypothetical protein